MLLNVSQSTLVDLRIPNYISALIDPCVLIDLCALSLPRHHEGNVVKTPGVHEYVASAGCDRHLEREWGETLPQYRI